MPSKGIYGSCYFGKSHFGNIARRKTDGVGCCFGIEIDNITEIVIIKIPVGVDTESCHHHIGYAVFNKLTVHCINGYFS
ncbi:hypothetical protein [Ruminococcus difficilis]|uniref:hypothetical protein n=1 Tax=Ruminococcus difficilis TaxID=2763069 RepID=UPI00164BFAF9|nr:hypothetical protein [Ruminococcus difficilis]MBQ3461655.1 hypothetical protein [Clostridia bacterium]MEE0839526.1 hypothetical protein [Acutalibacteraceae bacterium]